MADDTADRLTFLAVAPLGGLNVFAAVRDHEPSRRTLKRFGFSLESWKTVSSSRENSAEV